MCTYYTQIVPLSGSAKGSTGWFTLSSASVYFDHPVHAPGEHTVNVDFIKHGNGPAARVAVELDPAAARELAHAILAAVGTAETFGTTSQQNLSSPSAPVSAAGAKL